jgi:hypothetical protein
MKYVLFPVYVFAALSLFASAYEAWAGLTKAFSWGRYVFNIVATPLVLAFAAASVFGEMGFEWLRDIERRFDERDNERTNQPVDKRGTAV